MTYINITDNMFITNNEIISWFLSSLNAKKEMEINISSMYTSEKPIHFAILIVFVI